METRQELTTASMTLFTRNTEGSGETVDLNTEKIKEWRSIITLIVFFFASE